MSLENALTTVIVRAAQENSGRPLCVMSANLDHITHFGSGAKWADTFEVHPVIEWLTLLDGKPLVDRANTLTRGNWPRLAGSDIIDPILHHAAQRGLRLGFLGGSPEAHVLVKDIFVRDRSELTVAGWWAPEREVLEDPEACETLCSDVRGAQVDILVVCLGKPRQELWIAKYGALTGAKVLLAFGAVIDFLAGRICRAPLVLQMAGLEWAWRLALEPRRLARRYILEGPLAYRRLRIDSGKCAGSAETVGGATCVLPAAVSPGRFVPLSLHADVAVLIVTYNNYEDIKDLLESLRHETTEQSIKVVVADNSPTRETLDVLALETDVTAFATGGNRGYSGGINAALSRAGTAESYLVLNPDLHLEPGSISALRGRMVASNAGVVVPMLLDDNGQVYPSLRREPSISRAAGDALMGLRIRRRSVLLSEVDADASSYETPHTVDWATGAALLIRSDLATSIGPWDERFFLYSEEVDFFRRVRERGAKAWFEPGARMIHRRGGSGTSRELAALMTVNRIRYARKYCSPAKAAATRCIVAAGELARVRQRGHWYTFLTLLDSRRWADLPHATWYPSEEETSSFPSGSVVIPAHNEAAVIGRTLATLKPAMRSGAVEVIVVCNGCTDGTDRIAESFPWVSVVRISTASKIAALNAGDRTARRWPRIYLDADIELPPAALRLTLAELSSESGPLAARPAFEYDTDGASWAVRAYFRARNRLPVLSASLWGAGVFGVSYRGHSRFGEFPPITGDDLFVDGLYSSDEKSVLDSQPVRVRTPRSASALRHTLKRVYRGNAEQKNHYHRGALCTMLELLGSVHGPRSALDAAVYMSFALSGRWHPGSGTRATWERDDSSRGLIPKHVVNGEVQS